MRISDIDIVAFYTECRASMGIEDSITATAKHFGISFRRVDFILGFDERRRWGR